MKVGIFGSEYQIERQNLIKRLFEKLREQIGRASCRERVSSPV